MLMKVITEAEAVCKDIRYIIDHSEGIVIHDDDEFITPWPELLEGGGMSSWLRSLNRLEAALKSLEAEGGEHD